MEFMSPLFEFDHIDDLFPLSPLQEHTIPHINDLFSLSPLQEHTIPHIDNLSPSLENKNIISKPNRKRKSLDSLVTKEKNDGPCDRKNKKIIHREVERQRRQEMAALNRSLKSLLPPECLKGKRSLSDHMHETVNYINYMQKKIGEISKKRDELKRSSNKLSIYVGSKCLSSNFDGNEEANEISKEDIQVVLSTSLNADVALSRLLHLLTQEGLNVISSTSTILNGRLVHTIQSKVSEGRSIDPYELQKELKHLIPNVYI